MAISTAAAIIGSAVVGAGSSVIAGNKAAKATTKAAESANEVQRYIFDTQRADNEPWRQVGVGALGQLADLYGVPRGSAPTSMAGQTAGGAIYGYEGLDGARGIPASATTTAPAASGDRYGSFFASPGYQFRVDEAMKAIERSAAARGSLRSGATMDALQRRVQGVASDEFSNYSNRLAALAGVGQTANAANAAAGQNFANQFGQNTLAAGNARASAYANTGSAINGGIQNATAAYLYTQGYGGGGFGGSRSPTTGGFGGGTPWAGEGPRWAGG